MSMNLNTKSQITEFVSASPQPQDVVSNRIPANGRSRRSLLSQNLPALSEGSSQEATVLMQLTTDKNTSRSLSPEQVKDQIIDWVKEGAMEWTKGEFVGKGKFVRTREVDINLPFAKKVILTYDEATTTFTVKKPTMSGTKTTMQSVPLKQLPVILRCVYKKYSKDIRGCLRRTKSESTAKVEAAVANMAMKLYPASESCATAFNKMANVLSRKFPDFKEDAPKLKEIAAAHEVQAKIQEQMKKISFNQICQELVKAFQKMENKMVKPMSDDDWKGLCLGLQPLFLKPKDADNFVAAFKTKSPTLLAEALRKANPEGKMKAHSAPVSFLQGQSLTADVSVKVQCDTRAVAEGANSSFLQVKGAWFCGIALSWLPKSALAALGCTWGCVIGIIVVIICIILMLTGNWN